MAPELDILPDAVIADEEDPRQVFDVLLAGLREHRSYRWDSLMVRRVLETSHVSRCMAGRGPLSVVRESAGYCCVMHLDDRRQPLLSRKFRASLRNARNRLRAFGPLEFACHVDPDAVDRAFRDYVAIEASGWKAREDHGKAGYSRGQAMSLDAAKLAFYRHLVQAFGRTGHARIYQLSVGGTAIAAQIALVLDDVCYLLKTAYADAHARLSPGHMLLEQVVRHHADAGDVALINFVSDYPWLSNWKPQRLPYVSYECFNTTARGRLRGVQRHATALWAARRLRK